jgi:preprotein translocase subunit YajC
MDILKTMLITWSDDEVSQAWTLVAEEGKQRQTRRTQNMKYTLVPGDRVSFQGRKSGSVTGTIVRIKTKKAIVEVSGQNWDVPLAMLKKA